ncbi:PTS system fructose IIA component [Companilactobacillus paralimentarius DSM 13238 = JCM 10415]|uniref:PTS system fructose IIA component n=3 Tax=Companilactobacillus TaxID=2767879 RepID=A0ABR5NSE7_9LACO|nr:MULTISPECIES: PTS sugar transporter subunit IIA [Companilactobacillus]KAE9557855.1 PTS fructose transporter subunit IIA [Companilactobacillus kimchii]KAE9565065.1 PTS fructose transporter subunit IIA [Companilactobacillus paralimentarius]KRK50990.1 PTS system fructose IIA component [Companilactobacillus kimchii DSM 13961 = JCM 10707]KRL31585.1 PTS system fructose IIA component [Companilactobacillus paralimentarius DSM 13238 = JCM 10415]MDR4932384.1 PTS sugar transporter subunit IIA [Compani
MNKILIASHGHLASGVQSSLEILTGMGNKVTVIDAYVDDHDYVPDIKKFIDELDGQTGIIFTDLFGGSVNQKVMLEVADHENVFVITGTNLPIVLSVVLEGEEITKAKLEELIAASQVQLVEEPKDDTDLSDDSFLE